MTDNTPEVYDLDAIDNEASFKPIIFTLDGKEYQALTMSEVDLFRLTSIEATGDAFKDALNMIGLIFPRKTFNELKQSGKLTLNRAGYIMDSWYKHHGIDLENLEDSSDSPESDREN